MPKDFKPPKQTETHSCIFDRETGEILATHTRWVDEGSGLAADEAGGELLRSLAADSGRAAADLDVLPIRPLDSYDGVRVDLKARKLAKVRGQPGKTTLPGAALRRP